MSSKQSDLLSAAYNIVLPDSQVADWSPDGKPHPQIVFWAVYNSIGIIGNGGFEYFFERDWIGQPPYKLFIDAHHEIGALEAAQVLEFAVLDFPFQNPHLYDEKDGKE